MTWGGGGNRGEVSLGQHSSDTLSVTFEIGSPVGLEEAFPVSLPVAVIKHSDKITLREEGFIVAHRSRVQKHGREVKATGTCSTWCVPSTA